LEELILANATLSHLSYGPVSISGAAAVEPAPWRVMWRLFALCQGKRPDLPALTRPSTTAPGG